MSFVKFNRPELPTRAPEISIPANTPLMVFNQDLLATYNLNEWKFISMWWDEGEQAMGFREADYITDIAAFDFCCTGIIQATVDIQDFIEAHGGIVPNKRKFSVFYDEGIYLYKLTEIVEE